MVCSLLEGAISEFGLSKGVAGGRHETDGMSNAAWGRGDVDMPMGRARFLDRFDG